VIFSDLHDPKVEDVYVNGTAVAADGRLLPTVLLPAVQPMAPAMNVRMEKVDFSIPEEGGNICVIGIVPDQLITHHRVMPPTVGNRMVIADPVRDLLKIAVVERHLGTGDIGKGFVKGLGLRKGAIASSVAHDSHNIIVAGANDEDMMTAVVHIVKMGGGLAAVCDGSVLADLELPIAGLMSTMSLAEVRKRLDRLIESARGLGASLHDPFMTLSFLALPVIPELKITDKGLIDVIKFEPVGLFVA
jgi:adenine deaminase